MKFRILPLERRILLDAAAIVDLVDQTSDDAEVNDFESLDVGSSFSPDQGGRGGGDAPKVLLVSSEVDGYEALSKASNSEVVIVYDANQTTLDGLIGKITEKLGGEKAGSIAFATHGASASLDITAKDRITLQSLRDDPSHESFWNDLGSLVEDGGRIDFLACDLAGNQAGLSLINQIEALTQKDVAASDNLTGNEGDWFLERGGIDALSFYFDPQLILNWEGSLVDPGIIEGIVWSDVDLDGVFDIDFEGVSAEVVLYDETDTEVSSQTTVDGTFSFSVDPEFEGYVEILLDDGTGTFDSGADVDASGISGDIDLDGTEGLAIEALVNYDNDVTGTLFNDLDRDGVFDTNEEGASGVVVQLSLGSGEVIRETVTDSGGFYEFENILPGDYTITVFAQTTSDIFIQDSLAVNDIDFTIAGDDNLEFDGGVILHKIGGIVWLEDIIDGLRNSEERLEGITVNLYDVSSGETLIETTTTGVDGFYQFENLVDGEYLLEVINPNPDLAFTLQDQGGLENFDSDVDLQGRVTLSLSATRLNVGAGLAQVYDAGGQITFEGVPQGFREFFLRRESDPTFEIEGETDPLGNYNFEDLYAFTDYFIIVPEIGGEDFLQGEGFNQLSFGLTMDRDDLDIDLKNFSSIEFSIWEDFYNLIASDPDENPDGDFEANDTLFSGEIQINLYATDIGSFNPLSPPPILEQISSVTNGIAEFTGLINGDYVVEFLLPEDFDFVDLSTTEGDTVDNDIDPDTGLFGVTINNSDFDFGVALREDFNKVEGIVFHDLDSDGVFDLIENPIEGITVTLLDASDNEVDTTTTDSFGKYYFLLNANFDGAIRIEGPTGTSYQTIGDSGVDATGVGDFSFTLNQTNVDDELIPATINAPLFFTNSISGEVFEDTERDGDVFDLVMGDQVATEVFFPGARVELIDSQGTVIDQIFLPDEFPDIPTGDEGAFLFENLLPGDYTIRVSEGLDDATYFTTGVDQDFNQDGEFEVTSLTGTDEITANALIARTLVSGFIFNDLDGNGIYDSGTETLQGGVSISFTDREGVEFSTQTTDGNFQLEGLQPGNYLFFVDRFNVDLGGSSPVRFSLSPQDQGSNETLDSDVNPLSGDTEITLSTVLNDLGAGLIGTSEISGTLYKDDDGNDTFDTGEDPISGTTLLLLNLEDATLSTTTTTSTDGSFSFNVLPEGEYRLIIDPDLDEIPFAYENSNTGDSFAVSGDLALGDIGLIPVADSSAYEGIGGEIWEDVNEDLTGVLGEAADGIRDLIDINEDVLINLYDSTLTDYLAAATPPTPLRSLFIPGGSFEFLFPLLPTGTYVVEAVPLSGAQLTLQGVVSGLEGNALNPETGLAEITLATGGISDLGIGFVDTGSASGVVFSDTDFDGRIDPNENFLEGISITIGRDSDPLFSIETTTDFLGRWSVPNLVLSSDYFVLTADPIAQTTFRVSPIGPGLDNLANIDGRINFSLFQLATSNDIPATTDLNTGLAQVTNSLSGTVFEDEDGDGVFDTSESGLNNASVQIVRDSLIVASTTTNASGEFSFSNIHPGTYTLVVDDQVGSDFYIFTEGVDSDVDAAGEAPFFIRHLDTQNFSIGMIPTEIVATVFEDANANGIFDPSESGVNGVTVEVLDGTTQVATGTTNAQGQVTFEGLESKLYTLKVTAPTGATFTLQDIGAQDLVDSDVDPLTGEVDFTLDAFSDTLGAGIVFPRDLSGTLYEDTNADENKQGSESALSDVTLTLRRASDETFAVNVVTNASGEFAFNDLIPFSDYYIQVNSLDVAFTIINSTIVPVPTLTSDTTGFDIGLVPSTSTASTFDIGGFAWQETPPVDNVFSSGETLVEGVFVNLYEMTEDEYLALKEAGDLPPPIFSTQTDSLGEYSFDDLLAREYVIEVVPPVGKIFVEEGNSPASSDVDDVLGIIAIDLTADATSLDIGLIDLPNRIEGVVFHNANGDTTFDSGEAPIARVLVEFYDSSGNFVGFTSTDQSGKYGFIFEEDFTGTALFTPIGPASAYNATGTITVDSTGESDAFTVLLTQTTATTLDVGLTYNNTVSGTVEDASSTGIEGVTVTLYNDAGASVATAQTDSSGDYTFSNIRPNRGYRVEIGTSDTNSDQYHITGGDIDENGNALVYVGPEGSTTVDAELTINEISGVLFSDVNNNGINDAGDTFLSGQTISLTPNGGTAVTTTTDANGLFSFTGIANGDYTIDHDGLLYTFQDVGMDDNSDSDVSQADGTFSFTLKNTFTNIGIGTIPNTYEIGGTIWDDSTGSTAGTLEMGETTFDNVVVELWRVGDTAPVATTTTAGGGAYSFANIIPQSNYFIVINRDGNVLIDFNESASTAVFDLTANATYDFPLTPITGTPFSITGFTWTEAYTDFFGSQLTGVYSATDDTLLEGVRLFLYETDLAGFDATAAPFRTTVTDVNGAYTFGPFDDTTGPYVIQAITPEGSAFTVTGDNHDVNSDGRVEVSTTVTTADIGFIDLQSVSGTVWFDENSDGVLDGGEDLLEGVSVTLTADDDAMTTFTVQTDVNGLYLFENLVRGQYTIDITKPSFATEFTQTGGDSLADSNGEISLNLNAADVTEQDAGVRNTYSISGTAFIDNYDNIAATDTSAPNGIFDTGESAYEGLTVDLFALTADSFLDPLTPNNLLASTTTDASGNYSFGTLDPGTYLIVPRLEGEFRNTFDHQGSDPSVDSNIGFYSGFGVVLIPEGQRSQTVADFDIGLLETASAGGAVWNDLNIDGILDPNETGLEGAQILLKSPFGGFWRTIESNFAGSYQFNNLLLGEGYEARVILPELGGELLGFSPTGVGLDNKADGLGIINFDLGRDSSNVPLDDFGQNAGVSRLFTLSGFAFSDAYTDYALDPGDGIFQASESLIEGAVVTLYFADNPNIEVIKPDTTLATATTDINGEFTISGLLPGDYIAEVTLPTGYVFTLKNQGADEDLDSEINQEAPTGLEQEVGRSDAFFVGEDSKVAENFGIGALEAYSVGDQVFADRNANGIFESSIDFIDTNNNGIFDSGDLTNVAGIEIFFYSEDSGLVFSTFSTNDGYQLFNVPKGVYILDAILPGDLEASPSNVGTDDTIDSDLDTDNPDDFPITVDQDTSDVDIGVLPEVELEVTAFEDLNGNSVYDSEIDLLLEGIEVQLIQNNTILQEVLTNSDGVATFAPIPGGSYFYQVDFGTGNFVLVDANEGSNDAIDSDFTLQNPGVATYSFDNIPAQTIDVAIGLTRLGSITGIVWSDDDSDGVREDGEDPLENITVELFNTDDLVTPFATTTTNALGEYSFDDVPTGTYIVKVGLPASEGFTFTFPNIGFDTTDSDVSTPGGESNSLNMRGNTFTIDAGIVPTYSLSGLVWEDLNYNNAFDPGEGIEGVRVLATGSGVQFDAFTDSNGNYTFDNLIQGQYDIGVVAPENYTYMYLSDDHTSNIFGLENDIQVGEGITPSELITGLGEVRDVGDLIFLDANGNGLFDQGEEGVEGVRVEIGFTDPDLAAYSFFTFSDENGAYNLRSFLSSFTVEVIAPAGYAFTDQDVGSDETIDSDFDGSGLFGPAVLTAENLDIDAGLRTFHDLSGTAWVDANVNGLFGNAENVLAGVAVDLLRVNSDLSTTLVEQTVTDSSGNYFFTDIVNGNYIIAADLSATAYSSFTLPGFDSIIESGGQSDLLSINGFNQDFTDLDIGARPFIRIGDRVFLDSNANGIQDAGEGGVSGVTVRIFNLNDQVNPLETTTTNVSGIYSFTDLAEGNYFLEFDLSGLTNTQGSPIYTFTLANQGNNEAIDSDANQTTGRTSIFFVSDGFDSVDFDAGVVTRHSIEGTFFYDENGNGLFDEGGNEVEGITLELFNANGITTGQIATTNALGEYSFLDLDPGSYFVRIANLSAGGVDYRLGTGADSDFAADTLRSNLVTFDVPGEAATFDGALRTEHSATGFTFLDGDGDGIQDAGEGGVSGVLFTLRDSEGALISTAVSDSNGNYTFEEVLNGGYFIEADAATLENLGFQLTVKEAGGNPLIDSDFDPATFDTDLFTLSLANPAIDLDAGLIEVDVVRGIAWYDADGSGLRDAPEEGVEGVLVNLFNEDGTFTGITAETNASGEYTFFNLNPGTYYVEIDLSGLTENNYFIGVQGDGTNPEFDSDINPANNQSQTFQVAAEGTDVTIDVGLRSLHEITGTAFYDLNGNALFDAGTEDGIEGIEVELLLGDGTATGQTVLTDAQGVYSFTDLINGEYFVRINTFASGGDTYVIGVGGAFNTQTAQSTLIQALVPSNTEIVDAPFRTLHSVGDKVFLDANEDGIQDPGEEGVQGVIVNLINPDTGQVIGGVETDANGEYLITDILNGTYQIEFILPSENFTFSPQFQGSDPAADSNADQTGLTDTFTLNLDNPDNLTIDAGLIQLYAIGDRVFLDLNENGLQDLGEQGIGGIEISLFDSLDNLIATTESNAQGFYSFNGLNQGDYYIRADVGDLPFSFTAQNVGGDDAIDSDVDQTGESEVFTLGAQNDFTRDVGLVPFAGVTGIAFRDLDRDGIQDIDDIGLEGITVNLIDENGVLVSATTTDAFGRYFFSSFDTSLQYLIEFVEATGPGFGFTLPNQGGNDLIDSDVDQQLGRTPLFSFDPDETLVFDAGFIYGITVGDRAFNDSDGDGIQDNGENGIEGVAVTLLDSQGKILAQTVTDSQGFYAFNNVLQGEYLVSFETPENAVITQQGAGNNPQLDSDIDSLGQTDLFTVDGIGDRFDLDAGYRFLYRIGDFVFNDINGNGLQDSFEAGVSGVNVSLFNAQNQLIDQTTTDGNGNYFFDVLNGDYTLKFDLPAEFEAFSPQDQGGDDTIDSDANAQGEIAVTVFEGDNLTLDAGLLTPPGNLTGTVYEDLNLDGNNDQEIPLSGIVVRLINESGIEIASVVTDAFGEYLFSNIQEGDYTLVVERGGYLTSAADLDGVGDNGEIRLEAEVVAGQTTGLDVGIADPGSVEGEAWVDSDVDGRRDPSEPSLEGILVNLFNADGALIAQTTTDSNGIYQFGGLNPLDSYTLAFERPDNFSFTLQNQGGDDTIDSDVSFSSGRASFSFESSGEAITDIDAGYVERGDAADNVAGISESSYLKAADALKTPGYDPYRFEHQEVEPRKTELPDASPFSLFDTLKRFFG